MESNPAGINCGWPGATVYCAADFAPGTAVTLHATPRDSSYLFTGWVGDCTGLGDCAVSMTQARSVIATFKLQTYALTVTKMGTGTGTVASNPGGIDCGGVCSLSFVYGTSTTLTATAATGSLFDHWEGACSGTTPTCAVSMTESRDVTAVFTLVPALTVGLTGAGTVTSDPPGITCGPNCTKIYPIDTQVTLTAVPGLGSAFQGWGQACTGTTPTCQLVMSGPLNVTAAFFSSPTLTVMTIGTGTGTVISDPPGINCGTECTLAYAFIIPVTLTAVPGLGSAFQGWGQACTGTTPTCTFLMDRMRTVSASFILAPSLTTNRRGTGTGTITSDPPGINCGTDCIWAYPYRTSVTLTAVPGPGSVFDHWEGDCAGPTTMPTCATVMTSARTVTAFFTFQPAQVTIHLNQSIFGIGGSLTLGVTVTPGATLQAVDAYIALGLPTGTLLFLQGDGSLTSNLRPIVTNWTPTALTTQLFAYRFGGAEPMGSYTWYAAFTVPGGNPLFGTLGPIVSTTFSFSP